MAANVVGAVWDVRGIDATQRIVLLRLADVAHPDGTNAYLSVNTIHEDCEVSERTVQRTLAALVDRGYLVVQTPATNRRPTVYRVTVAGLRAVPTEPARGDNVTPLDVAGGDVGVTLGRHWGDTAMSPDPRSEIQEPESESESPLPPLRVTFWERACKLRGLISLSPADDALIDAWIVQGVTLSDWDVVDAEITAWAPDHPWAAFKSAMGSRVARGARPARLPTPIRAYGDAPGVITLTPEEAQYANDVVEWKRIRRTQGVAAAHAFGVAHGINTERSMA